MQVGDTQVHVGTDTTPDRSRERVHVAYEVIDLGELRRRLENTQVEVAEAVRIPGFERFEVRDPFRNGVEFVQRAR